MATEELPGWREVHVWTACLERNERQVLTLEALLSPEERARANRVRRPNHRTWFIVGRALLRRILAYYIGIDPAGVELGYGPYGKPYLKSDFSGPALDFSASHSGGIALYGVATNRRIGVDIEWVRPIPELQAIATGRFCHSELSVLRSLTPPAQMHKFFEFWTRKESYLKARGCGFAGSLLPLNRCLDQDVSAGVVDVVESHGATTRWFLSQGRWHKDCRAAIAVEGPVQRVLSFSWQETGPKVWEGGETVPRMVPVA
jgi:4'-phosphopantetheinyl transferase